MTVIAIQKASHILQKKLSGFQPIEMRLDPAIIEHAMAFIYAALPASLSLGCRSSIFASAVSLALSL